MSADDTRPAEAPAAPQTPKWHVFHSDKVNDVCLKSSDNVYFRASSTLLKRESTMFSGMLANIPNPYMQPAQAIPLDFPWMSISIFLDAALSRTRLDYKACSFTDLHRYRKLVHHLDCDRLVPHADIAFRYACKAKPIEWLYCASEEDDLPTAISALQMCRAENVGITSKMVFDMTWRVRLEWRQPLLKCLLHGGDSDSDIEVDELRTRWPKTSRAKQFESDVIKARAEMSG